MLATLLALVAVLGQKLLDGSSRPCAAPDKQCLLPSASLEWAQYSPFAPAPSVIDAATPAGCRLTFGSVLSRHGSRFPTRRMAKDKYAPLFEHLQRSVTEFRPGFEFLRDFELDPRYDELTALGKLEMVESGRAFFHRYRDLASSTRLFIRAAGSDRVIMSAQNFTQGFSAAQGRDPSDAIAGILIIPEEEGVNNTLDHSGCPAFEDGPAADVRAEKQKPWKKMWATPIMGRLNDNLPGANLSLSQAIYMMDQCPYNSVIEPDTPISDFCNLFSRDEWRDYGYYHSLAKWYGYGNGNPLGPTQGVGYVNELIARLTGRPVLDHTKSNSTLDADPKTFPVDRTLYADFSHDNTMTSIYGALGLYNATRDLPLTHRLSPEEANGYSAAWTVPFAARMYVEKMRCGDDDKEMVRILVNDRVVPLQGCGADALGRCSLDAFIGSLTFARAGGWWDTCSEEARERSRAM
ncbi:histidine acid phosphatase [Ophiocordyceps camponoti-floridani]|uniref:Phytase A n=1 Tax=Ophiocordyceps camponoti-floridani TaxID=2030778 RepID=A0A8H4Q6D8_9HYPO|nr:histidine acid phosphatase [Ophiocordyceps camponoti-floridani]